MVSGLCPPSSKRGGFALVGKRPPYNGSLRTVQSLFAGDDLYPLPLLATESAGFSSFMTSRTAVSSWRSWPARLSSGVFST